MKKFSVCLIGLAFLSVPMFAMGQTFTANRSAVPAIKVEKNFADKTHSNSWDHVTQDVRGPYRGYHGNSHEYHGYRPAHAPRHDYYHRPAPTRHHHTPYIHPHYVPTVPVMPVYPYSHHHGSGFSIQIGGPHGGFYFNN